jgi:hypothetical protein
VSRDRVEVPGRPQAEVAFGELVAVVELVAVALHRGDHGCQIADRMLDLRRSSCGSRLTLGGRYPPSGRPVDDGR